MAARSIIDIQVNDDKFKAFNAMFGRYQSQLGKMPGQWANVGKAAAQAAKDGDKAHLAQLDTVNDTLKAILAAVTAEKELGNQAKKSTSEFKKTLKTVRSIGSSVAKTTFHLLKWVALGGVLGLAGGGFGIAATAGAASSQLRQARGMGVSPGELNAARVNYGPYVNAESTLGNIADAKSDLSKRWVLQSLGLDPSKSAGALLPDVLSRSVALFKQRGSTTQAFQSAGLDKLMDMDDMRRMSGLPAGELQRAAGGYNSDRSRLGVDDATLSTMQRLNQQFERAGREIENVFIRGLVPLAPQLTSLSESVVKALATFMASPKMGEWIEKFGRGIESTAEYLGSGRFQTTAGKFLDALDALASGVLWVSGLFGGNNPAPSAVPNTGGASGSWGVASGGATGSWGVPPSTNRHNPGNLRSWDRNPTSGGFAVFPTEDAGLRAMAQQLRMYASGTSSAAGRRKLDTIGSIVPTYAPGSDGNNVQAYIADMVKQTGFRADQHLNFNDPKTLATFMAAQIRHETGSSVHTAAGIRAVITVQNQTGGNAVVMANQLAH